MGTVARCARCNSLLFFEISMRAQRDGGYTEETFSKCDACGFQRVSSSPVAPTETRQAVAAVAGSRRPSLGQTSLEAFMR